jgi:hypothetical protein
MIIIVRTSLLCNSISLPRLRLIYVFHNIEEGVPHERNNNSSLSSHRNGRVG